MKISRVDANGITIGNRWLRYDNPEFPTGTLYTEDEHMKKVRNILNKQGTVRIEDYQVLLDKLKKIKEMTK